MSHGRSTHVGTPLPVMLREQRVVLRHQLVFSQLVIVFTHPLVMSLSNESSTGVCAARTAIGISSEFIMSVICSHQLVMNNPLVFLFIKKYLVITHY